MLITTNVLQHSISYHFVFTVKVGLKLVHPLRSCATQVLGWACASLPSQARNSFKCQEFCMAVLACHYLLVSFSPVLIETVIFCRQSLPIFQMAMIYPLLQVGSFFFLLLLSLAVLCAALFVCFSPNAISWFMLIPFSLLCILAVCCLGSPMLVPLLWAFEHVLTDRYTFWNTIAII